MEPMVLNAVWLVALSIAVGVWLHRLDRPLNRFVYGLHKLSAVAAVMITFAVFIRSGRMDNVTAVLTFAALAGVMVVVLFLSGVMLNLDKFSRKIMLRIHDVATVVFVLSSTITIDFLMK
jgi:hypothetical protein